VGRSQAIHNRHARLSAILFDLDGTLTDPLEGITRSIQHALEKSGAPSRTTDELARFIGPPLRGTFAYLLETQDPPAVESALRLYRQRFAAVGLFENTVYDGVPEMLEALQRNAKLFVATSKPRVFAERIVEHFGLARFFAGVYGAELDGRFDDKTELLAHLLDSERLLPGTTTMVGDRSHDIVAAKRNRLRSIGVSYGYGTDAELRDAGADHICASPAELVAFFRLNRPRNDPRMNANGRE